MSAALRRRASCVTFVKILTAPERVGGKSLADCSGGAVSGRQKFVVVQGFTLVCFSFANIEEEGLLSCTAAATMGHPDVMSAIFVYSQMCVGTVRCGWLTVPHTEVSAATYWRTLVMHRFISNNTWWEAGSNKWSVCLCVTHNGGVKVRGS